MSFRRFRRIRSNNVFREMFRETHLSKNDLIYPLFIRTGEKIYNPVQSMPGVAQMSIDTALKECEILLDKGIRSIILFGIPAEKDETGSDAYNKDGIIQQAIREIKKHFPEMAVIGDVCLCEYTSHGHCGLLDGETILNDKTIDVLSKVALAQAEAGVDMVAPSDMMDGRVLAIRSALDKEGFLNMPIMSYAVKYASAYYGPFRDAAEGAPKFGDRRSHQMDYGNSDEAIWEAREDIFEGADIVMVKPAGAYLDIIRRVRDEFKMPTAAYQVSGEYSMIKAGGKLGWIDSEKVMIESLTSIKRAGADSILTYFAKEAADFLDKYGIKSI